jgi:hypothetical protein
MFLTKLSLFGFSIESNNLTLSNYRGVELVILSQESLGDRITTLDELFDVTPAGYFRDNIEKSKIWFYNKYVEDTDFIYSSLGPLRWEAIFGNLVSCLDKRKLTYRSLWRWINRKPNNRFFTSIYIFLSI